MKNFSQDFVIPSNKTAAELGKINVHPNGNLLDISLTILMEPEGEKAEGWQTGVALDASVSMKQLFGRTFHGEIPHDVEKEYEKKGWITNLVQDGRKVKKFAPQAQEEAIQKGYLKNSENIIEPLAQDFIAYLAGNLDADGGTTVIYWACGDGSKIETLGDFREEECKTLKIAGPTKTSFGNKTMLLPAMQHFVNLFPDAKSGMYIFLTDGKIEDLDAVKKYTTELAQKIQVGKSNFVKCVLIGVGDEIDEKQMEELDNLDTGTEVDIWDHKIAKEMRALVEIFAEVVSENQMIAPKGTVYDATGNVVKKYSDGVPAKIDFSIPANSDWFELEIGGRKIRQEITQ